MTPAKENPDKLKSKEHLEIEKIQLEINELNKRWFKKMSYSSLISIISGLLALGTISWTIFSGFLNNTRVKLEKEEILLEIRREKLNDSITYFSNKLDSIQNLYNTTQSNYEESIHYNTNLNRKNDSIATRNLNLNEQKDYYKRKADSLNLGINKILAAKEIDKSYLIKRANRRKQNDIESIVNDNDRILMAYYYKQYYDSLYKYKDDGYLMSRIDWSVFPDGIPKYFTEITMHEMKLFMDDENISVYLNKCQLNLLFLLNTLRMVTNQNSARNLDIRIEANYFFKVFETFELYLKQKNII